MQHGSHVDVDRLARARFMQRLSETAGSRISSASTRSFSRACDNYLWIRDKHGKVVRLQLRSIQRKYHATKMRAVRSGRPARFLLLKYRRGGFTTVEQAASYLLASRQPNVEVLTFAHRAQSMREIFKIPLLMHERDPHAPMAPESRSRLFFPQLNSDFSFDTAGGAGIGRGQTLSRAHWSEVAWSCSGKDQSETQRNILAGVTEAAEFGEIILETTPNRFEHFYELYSDAKQGKNVWTPIFLPWFEDDSNQVPLSDEEALDYPSTYDDEERMLVAAHGLVPQQVAFRRLKKSTLGYLFPQEYPENDQDCWMMSGTCRFEASAVRAIMAAIGEPEANPLLRLTVPKSATIIDRGWSMEFESPQPVEKYLMGVDTSEGIPGADPCGLSIVRRDTGKQVYAEHGYFPPRVLAERVCAARARYGNVVVGIERENHGHAVIQKCIDLGLNRPHYHGGFLYCFREPEPGSKGFRKSVLQDESDAGWSTNASTRPMMLDTVADMIVAEMDPGPDPNGLINDPVFAWEAATFNLQANGRFEADSGRHDDAIMKNAIAWMMRSTKSHRVDLRVV